MGPTAAIPVVAEFVDVELEDGTVIPSAAEAAGLQVGDRITAINGTGSDDFDELRIIVENPGRAVSVTVEREGVDGPLELSVTPATTTDAEGEPIGLFGFLPDRQSMPKGADEALYDTFIGPGSLPDMVVQTFVRSDCHAKLF